MIFQIISFSYPFLETGNDKCFNGLWYTGKIYLFEIQWCSLFIPIFWFNKYLPSCNVWLISLKFISHNNLEWIQTSLNFKWFKCMILVKPYTVWLDRLCWIKGASCMNFDVRWICILDTWHNTKLWKKKEPGTDTFLPVCAYPSIYNAHVWIILLWARA